MRLRPRNIPQALLAARDEAGSDLQLRAARGAVNERFGFTLAPAPLPLEFSVRATAPEASLNGA
jgi:hypothetical protein